MILLKLLISSLLCWLLLFACSVWAIDPEQLLQPEEAFRFDARHKDADKLLLSWDIADGYYLYRKKFKFVSQSPEIRFDVPFFHIGQSKQDKHFGTVEVYRKHLEVELPIQYPVAKSTALVLEVTFQGCADIGVCYMPIQKVISFDLPAQASEQ